MAGRGEGKGTETIMVSGGKKFSSSLREKKGEAALKKN